MKNGFSKQEVDFNVPNLIADVLNTNFYNARARGVKLFFEETENIPFTLKGDKVRMTQVCNNLVSNAIKFA